MPSFSLFIRIVHDVFNVVNDFPRRGFIIGVKNNHFPGVNDHTVILVAESGRLYFPAVSTRFD
jgi:hypothetical protein